MENSKHITMTQLGRMGRFANQLFQYAFLRAYAEIHELQLQVPAWVGNELFGLVNPPVTVRLPRRSEGYVTRGGTPLLPRGREFCGKDFVGWAQFHTSWYRPHREKIREWFRPVPAIRQRMAPAVAALRNAGQTQIGIHLRRGDYGQRNFPVIPTSWYLAWLEKHWGRFERPVLFIATEDPALVKDFNDYAPLTAEGLGIDLKAEPLAHYKYLPLDRKRRDPWQMDFYPDFHLLQHCDVLVTPSSTFSFFPAMLNDRLLEFWRASLEIEGFERLDLWDSYPLLREDVKDFAHLQGIELKKNPHW